MEPGVTDEILGNQRRTAHLAFGVVYQAAVGLNGECNLGDTGDDQG